MNIIFTIGAILLGGFFVYNAINHFRNIGMLTGYAHSKRVPGAKFAVVFTGIMLLVGGLYIMTGFLFTAGLWIEIVFLIGVTGFMHRFWEDTDPARRAADMMSFSKNLAILGALLMLAAK